ncbi:hypothetical protein KM1_011080 [Entamoeba histolytica HM-3:IMSS]|uniref:Uncharacterized protein n=1 Tax=Entamoeba histolytica HM-3:IMSS TaxID=885315 RepID=M7WJS9_ENTHI|nr:hypothetical protein KM1_011080 [Entamoeba histolytica HM-3:IMSS]
MKNLLILN